MVPGRVAGDERVDVTVDPSGKPWRVEVAQRLVLNRRGDYSFVVPAPLSSVVALPGSDAEPGQRTGGIVWQGFSPGKRLLGARATLDPALAGRWLPLRVSAAWGPRRVTVHLANVTSTPVPTITASVVPADIVEVLDLLRKGPAFVSPSQVRVVGAAHPAVVQIDAPLRVRVVVGNRSFVRVLGGGAPLLRTIQIRVSGSLRPRIRVEAVPLASSARPPGGSSWAAALRAGLLPDGRRLLRTATVALLRSARAGQYRTFLVNPDPNGLTRTSYVYRVAAPPPAASPPVPAPPGDGSPVLLVLAVVGGLLLAAAALVAWAHL